MFDFDDLDEEEEKIAAEDTRPAAGGWQPVPPEVWKALPPFSREDTPKTFKEFKENVNQVEKGEFWGLEFPFTPTQLKEMGPKWLTKAMHTAGTLPEDNEITRFLKFETKAEDTRSQDADSARWGGACTKVLLKVAYKNGPGDLTEWMFVKIPHEFTGKNERQKNSLNNNMDWNEVVWYNIFGGRFGLPDFRSPRMYFSDMSRRTTNFINVIEMVEVGERGKGPVSPGQPFPPPEKYKDWDLPNNGIDYYYAHAKTLAQFFGWHKKMRETTTQIEDLFMGKDSQGFVFNCFEQMGKAGPYNSKARDQHFKEMLGHSAIQGWMESMPGNFKPAPCAGFLEMGQEFITKIAPQAFPKKYTEAAYVDRFFREAGEIVPLVSHIMVYTSIMPEYWSLIHPNAQVDNAWYWREMNGDVSCGLLDWGIVMHGSMANCMAGGWMGGEPEVMDEHEEKLLVYFIDEYEKITGVKLDFDDLLMHFRLARVLTLYGCCANIGTLLRTIKKDDWKKVKDRFDPKINDNFLMRCYFVQVEMLLAMWAKRSPYQAFKKWMNRVQLPASMIPKK